MSEYLDSAGLALYDGQIKAYIDSVSGNSTGVRIVTLTSVPTSSTTTYTIGSTTYNFKVGDEVKANGQYYKLYNLVTEGNTTTAVWNTLGTTYSVMGASGYTHASGLVPDTPSTAGTSKFLREDGTWNNPLPNNLAYLETSVETAYQAGFDPQTDTVWNKAQVLTEAQKAQVKANLDLQDIVFNTAYDATTNKAATMADVPVTSVNGQTGAVVIPNATTSAAGLMTAADKVKADNVMNLTNSETTTGSLELTPNTLYSLGALTGALTVTLGTLVSGVPNTYMMEFDIDDSAATPTKVPNFPATIVWKDEPTWTTGKHYEVSIRYSANTQAYYGIIAEFDTYVAE